MSSKMFFKVFGLFLALIHNTYGFYLPGLAPITYCSKKNVTGCPVSFSDFVYLSNLTSRPLSNSINNGSK